MISQFSSATPISKTASSMAHSPKLLFLSLCLGVLCGRSTLPQDSTSEHNPDFELASFTIAPGFEVNLFASEKDGVIKPIQIRFDPQGRLWVIGSTVYPQLEPGEVPNDKVLVLEDTNNDGVSDKTTVFADGLMIPTGIELGDGGVYVGHGTELLFLKDTDGDLKADERRVVLRGFGTGDNHQNINSFLFGPGGELWFSQGLHTRSNVETPWGIVRMNQAGLWRFHPRLKKLESFYGSVYEPQNPWGYVFTDWGEPIVIAGNNSSMIYPVPGLTSAHFSLPPHQIWKNGGGRKSSGADIVGTSHFPDDWQGLIITGGYINNAVWVLEIQDDGSGFALVDRNPLIKSTSRNFRPVDVKFGPDGSLYICDWYNPIIGHYQASFRHPDRDKTHGRIWRVTAKGRALTQAPVLSTASSADLITHLDSTDRWTRHFAKRELSTRDSKEVSNLVEAWRAAHPHANEHMLKELLGVLQSHETVNEQLLLQLGLCTNPGARAYAASAIGRWADRLPNPLDSLTPLATDPHPRVRLQAIVASSFIPKWQAIDIAARAAQLPTDKFIDYALRQTVFALKPHWQTAERLGHFIPAADEATMNLFLMVGEVKELSLSADALLGLAADFEKKLTIGKSIILYADMAGLNRIISLNDPRLRDALLPLLADAVDRRKLKAVPGTAEALRPLINENHPAAFSLAALLQLPDFRDRIHAAARNRATPEPVRIAAINGLRTSKGPEIESLLAALSKDESAPVRLAAVRTLTHLNLESAANLASQQQFSAADWKLLFEDFLQRQGGTAELAEAFTQHPPRPKISSLILQSMNETGRRDEQLVKILHRTPDQKLSLADLPDLIEAVRKRGNAERGKQVYERAELACVTCHAVKGTGGTIGPDLGALGTAQPISFIIGAILDPQKEVKEGYIATSLSTRDGDEFQGYIIRESETEIVLNDILQRTNITLRKDNIQHRRQSGSVMPAGLVDQLARQEFIDLIAYLSHLGE
jgi:putative heme-binding domain-containing protein